MRKRTILAPPSTVSASTLLKQFEKLVVLLFTSQNVTKQDRRSNGSKWQYSLLVCGSFQRRISVSCFSALHTLPCSPRISQGPPCTLPSSVCSMTLLERSVSLSPYRPSPHKDHTPRGDPSGDLECRNLSIKPRDRREIAERAAPTLFHNRPQRVLPVCTSTPSLDPLHRRPPDRVRCFGRAYLARSATRCCGTSGSVRRDADSRDRRCPRSCALTAFGPVPHNFTVLEGEDAIDIFSQYRVPDACENSRRHPREDVRWRAVRKPQLASLYKSRMLQLEQKLTTTTHRRKGGLAEASRLVPVVSASFRTTPLLSERYKFDSP